jgi:hypothetical protein
MRLLPVDYFHRTYRAACRRNEECEQVFRAFQSVHSRVGHVLHVCRLGIVGNGLSTSWILVAVKSGVGEGGEIQLLSQFIVKLLSVC